jgi:anti-sigma B factor antagonist
MRGTPGAPNGKLEDEVMTSSTESNDVEGGLPTLEVTGELDLAAAPWLRDQLDALFVGGADSIVVDLSGATFLDSTALGVLVSALHRSRELGGAVHLVVHEPQILRVLTITGLVNEFTLHEGGAALRGGTSTR